MKGRVFTWHELILQNKIVCNNKHSKVKLTYDKWRKKNRPAKVYF